MDIIILMSNMGGDDNKGGELNKATGLPKMDEEERDKGSS